MGKIGIEIDINNMNIEEAMDILILLLSDNGLHGKIVGYTREEIISEEF